MRVYGYEGVSGCVVVWGKGVASVWPAAGFAFSFMARES